MIIFAKCDVFIFIFLKLLSYTKKLFKTHSFYLKKRSTTVIKALTQKIFAESQSNDVGRNYDIGCSTRYGNRRI